MVFPTLFNLTLNFALRSSCSEPQLAPGLILADYIRLLHLWLQRIYSQPDFSIDHLVMSMCRVISCIVGRGCLIWPQNKFGRKLTWLSLRFQETSSWGRKPLPLWQEGHMANKIVISLQSLISCFLKLPVNRRMAALAIKGLWRGYSQCVPKAPLSSAL